MSIHFSRFSFFGLRLVVFSAFLPLALVLSGPIRTITSFSINSALAASVALLILAAVLLNPLLRRLTLSREIWLSALAFAVLCFLVLLKKLYHLPYDGLVTVGGGDAGLHINDTWRFVKEEPGIYQGFTSFYAFVYWLMKLGRLDAFAAFRAIFYFTGLFVIVCFAGMGAAILAKCSLAQRFLPLVPRPGDFSVFSEIEKTGKSPGLGQNEDKTSIGTGYNEPKVHPVTILVFFVLLFVFADGPSDRVLFPLLHYQQADGHYPHLLGLLPLFLCWLSYAAISQWFWRVAALGVGLVFYRYTYGLNLGDLAVAVCFISYWEARNFLTNCWARRAIAILLVGGLCVSVHLYRLLSVLLTMGGGFVAIDVEKVNLGVSLLSVFLLLGPFVLNRGFGIANSVVSRMCYFSGIFGAASVIIGFICIGLGIKQDYYFHKYHFHPAFLATCSSILLLSFVLLLLIKRLADMYPRYRSFTWVNIGQRWQSYCALALLLCLPFFGYHYLKHGYRSYWAGYFERKRGVKATIYMSPLADLKAGEIIDNTLAQKKKNFGGYISPSWPLFAFMNCSRFYCPQFEHFIKFTGGLRKKSCLFWDSSELAMGYYRGATSGKSDKFFGILNDKKTTQVIRYRVKWEPSEKEISIYCAD